MPFRLEGEADIAQKELGDLENIKIAADLSQKEKMIQLQKEKEKEIDLNFRIKKLKKAIGKGDFKGLIINRSQTQEAIGPQIGVSAKAFRKLESSEGNQEKIINFMRVRRMASRGRKSWIAPIPKRWKRMMQKKRNDPRKSEEKKQNSSKLN